MTPQPTVAHWIPARRVQMPPRHQAVLVAWCPHGDDELIVDLAEWDGRDWRFVGGLRFPRTYRLYFWAPAPTPPPRPQILRRIA